MTRTTSLVALAALLSFQVASVVGQSTPLASKTFRYDSLPYKADTDNGPRGIQVGYNLCNSTTEGQASLCQTGFITDISDFCIWGPPEENESVADTEGEMVAWCTKAGRGTRIIPDGALQGVQFMRTPHYIQVVGFIDQTKINIREGDSGGEEDPHGADQRGNPLGGLIFSSAFTGTNNSTSTVNGTVYTQVQEWSMFLGGNRFCFKACDPTYEGDARLCEHIYDRIGCDYNAPASYNAINGTFQSCLGDDQLPAGIYVGADGQTSTYQQPAESLGPITTVPYTAAIPASSSCTPYTSAQLFTDGARLAPLPTTSTTPSTSPASTGGPTSSAGSSRAPSGATTTGAQSTSSGAAMSLRVGSGNSGEWAGMIGVSVVASVVLAAAGWAITI